MTTVPDKLIERAKMALANEELKVEIFTEITGWLEVEGIATNSDADVAVFSPSDDKDQRLHLPRYAVKGVRVTKPSQRGTVVFG